MKPRLYFDTSVFGGIYDEEFEETSILLFEKVHQKKLYIMKKTFKKEKAFDTVKVFREIKERIAKETEKMNFQEFKEYLNRNKLRSAK